MEPIFTKEGDYCGANTVRLTRDDVLSSYFDHWVQLMYAAGKVNSQTVEELHEMCIDDWLVTNWGWVE